MEDYWATPRAIAAASVKLHGLRWGADRDAEPELHGEEISGKVMRSAVALALSNFADPQMRDEACGGLQPYVGVDGEVGMLVVKALDAMYRSAKSGRPEKMA